MLNRTCGQISQCKNIQHVLLNTNVDYKVTSDERIPFDYELSFIV